MWLLLGLLTTVSWAQTTVMSYDFEQASPQSPPPGWSMWGAEQYKTPANYTRDTTNPHGGQACFRLYHPAGTAGYVVSSPDTALRPKRDMIYRVSFWARTDKPGPSLFYFTGYESIGPFVDAPSPGSLTVNATTEWQQFGLEVREGLDFPADRSSYVLLTFNATRDMTLEKTLWIDDIVVTERPDPDPVRLVDESKLTYAPLQHRLKPGDRLELTLDTSQRLREAASNCAGVSFHRVCGFTGHPYDRQGKYTLPAGIESGIREMHLPMTRFYGVGDEPFGVEAGIDKVAEVCKKVGIPQETVVLEFETQGASTKIAPEVWAQGVRHSVQAGYKFHHWEISNEPYSGQWGSGGAFPTADDYVAHVKAVSAAIRAADPQARIGIGINFGSTRWGNYVLRQTAGCYDFVAAHHYSSGNVTRRAFEDVVLTDNFRKLDQVLRLNELIATYNPGRDAYQYDTEWGVHSSGPQGERADNVDRNGNIWGTVHRAVRLIYYTREALLRGASSWQMLSGVGGQGFGVLFPSRPDSRSLIYWLYYYFNRHVGKWALEMTGTTPWYTPPAGEDRSGQFSGPQTPVLATLSEGGRSVYLVIANGSWSKPTDCRVNLRNFTVAEATGVVLSSADPDGKPLVDRKEDVVSSLPVVVEGGVVSCKIPEHSVVFVTLQGR